MRSVLPLLAFGAAALLIAPAKADATAINYGFGCITQSNVGDCAIGEAQMTVTVSDDGLVDQVRFLFENSGPAASSIADVYVDDDLLLLLDIASITSNGTGGFSFSAGASSGRPSWR